MVWKPHVTVAAVLERDGRFLLVEELTEDGAPKAKHDLPFAFSMILPAFRGVGALRNLVFVALMITMVEVTFRITKNRNSL